MIREIMSFFNSPIGSDVIFPRKVVSNKRNTKPGMLPLKTRSTFIILCPECSKRVARVAWDWSFSTMQLGGICESPTSLVRRKHFPREECAPPCVPHYERVSSPWTSSILHPLQNYYKQSQASRLSNTLLH